MIDIGLLRDNPELVKEKTNQKGYKVDIDELVKLDKERNEQLLKVEELRQIRNSIADMSKKQKPTEEHIKQGKKNKEELKKLEAKLNDIEIKWDNLIRSIPNIVSDDVPIGGESDFVVISTKGETKTGAIDHIDFATKKDWVDFGRGAKVAGNKFYYIKGDLALLENAVVQFALNKLIQKDFAFMSVPHLVSSRIATGAGFAPRTSNQSDEYYIEGEDLTLIATAEIPLTGYHADEILNENDLPLKYAGYSPCYRKEAGAYGKHTRGLFRVHQFNKLEMYAFTTPETSKQLHEEIRNIEEEIWQEIGIPYRVINIASGDLGAAAAKKYDIEYWSPVDGTYRELTSCSNCTDFQTRNLNIKIRRKDGSIDLAHSLNGTAVAMARTLVAIIENFQTDTGNVKIPKVLQEYMGGREEI